MKGGEVVVMLEKSDLGLYRDQCLEESPRSLYPSFQILSCPKFFPTKRVSFTQPKFSNPNFLSFKLNFHPDKTPSLSPQSWVAAKQL